MQYTLRNIPRQLDQALRHKAKAEGKSLNSAALDALRDGLGIGEGPGPRRDLSAIAGTWISDPEVERSLRDQDQVDPELWP